MARRLKPSRAVFHCLFFWLRDLLPSVLNFYSKKKFEAFLCEQKSFPYRHTHSRDIINVLLTSAPWSVLQSQGSLVFPLQFTARALCTWAINQRGKTKIRHLQNGTRTRLVRGICEWSPCSGESLFHDAPFHYGIQF